MINRLATVAVAAALTLAAGVSQAAVTAQEAEQLKTTLTPLGAEKAGNKEGTIPAWDGGYTKVDPNWKPGQLRPDPFAADKPRLTITAKNMDQYKDKLTDGEMALLKKYPDFRMDIYPTHRSAAAPQWVYDNTYKNATRAKTIDDGFGVEGAYGGIPFPIPKDGYEVIWNQRLAWRGGEGAHALITTWVVTADGNRALATKGKQYFGWPYYKKNGSLETFDGYYNAAEIISLDPPYKVGEAILAVDSVDPSKEPRKIYQYLVGQRRVRKAPSVAYDTPDFVTSGIGYFDEAFGMFGPVDRYNMKLIGKMEKFIPYNENGASLAKIDELVKPKFLNPDHVRWELHRVWVVEATLKPGQRHVVPKRHYYIDEDNWQIALMDGWDAQNEIWRFGYNLGVLCPDGGGAYSNAVGWGQYNLQTGAYFFNEVLNESSDAYTIEAIPDSQFTPAAIANQGAR